MPAPILVFGFNRPFHLEKTLRALEANVIASKSDVFIFLDGARSNYNEIESVQACLDVAKLKFNFGSKSIIQRSKNLGLANSIRSGVSYVFESHETVIVLEDDIILAPNALDFLNEGLDFYEFNPKISSINAYQYPISTRSKSCVSLRGADCWGWATWKDRWEGASFDSLDLRQKLESSGLVHVFNLDGFMDYSDMLDLQIAGRIDSWAICWHLSMFLQDRLCVYPPKSLALNIGSDGTGTHAGKLDIFATELAADSEWEFPNFYHESEEFREQMKTFYKLYKPKRSLISRMKSTIHSIWKIG